MPSRKPVSANIRLEILIEAGYRCAVPTCRTLLVLDAHHIDQVSEGGGSEPSNLIALCPTCHALYHRGRISKAAIQVWKGILVSLNQAFDRDAKDKLIFLSLSERPHLFSADGVLQFSSLIASKLVRCGPERLEVNARGVGADISKARYPVELTEKGKMVLNAWQNGDPKALKIALSTDAGP